MIPRPRGGGRWPPRLLLIILHLRPEAARQFGQLSALRQPSCQLSPLPTPRTRSGCKDTQKRDPAIGFGLPPPRRRPTHNRLPSNWGINFIKSANNWLSAEFDSRSQAPRNAPRTRGRPAQTDGRAGGPREALWRLCHLVPWHRHPHRPAPPTCKYTQQQGGTHKQRPWQCEVVCASPRSTQIGNLLVLNLIFGFGGIILWHNGLCGSGVSRGSVGGRVLDVQPRLEGREWVSRANSWIGN